MISGRCVYNFGSLQLETVVGGWSIAVSGFVFHMTNLHITYVRNRGTGVEHSGEWVCFRYGKPPYYICQK